MWMCLQIWGIFKNRAQERAKPIITVDAHCRDRGQGGQISWSETRQKLSREDKELLFDDISCWGLCANSRFYALSWLVFSLSVWGKVSFEPFVKRKRPFFEEWYKKFLFILDIWIWMKRCCMWSREKFFFDRVDSCLELNEPTVFALLGELRALMAFQLQLFLGRLLLLYSLDTIYLTFNWDMCEDIFLLGWTGTWVAKNSRKITRKVKTLMAPKMLKIQTQSDVSDPLKMTPHFSV